MVNKKRHKIKQTKVVDATVKFIMWFEHFIKTVQPQARDSPTLLILDGHASHVRNLDLIEKVRDNNVLQLCLPCHCTHRLQPLDVSFFKSRNWHYDEEIRNWMHEHDGRRVTEYDVAGIFATAYAKAATHQNARNVAFFLFAKTCLLMKTSLVLTLLTIVCLLQKAHSILQPTIFQCPYQTTVSSCLRLRCHVTFKWTDHRTGINHHWTTVITVDEWKDELSRNTWTNWNVRKGYGTGSMCSQHFRGQHTLHTNNYCEVTVRLFKYHVLIRCKAYNVIALVDFIIVVVEKFYRGRLERFANGRVTLRHKCT